MYLYVVGVEEGAELVFVDVEEEEELGLEDVDGCVMVLATRVEVVEVVTEVRVVNVLLALVVRVVLEVEDEAFEVVVAACLLILR